MDSSWAKNSIGELSTTGYVKLLNPDVISKALTRAQARGLASLDWALIWRCLCSLILLFPEKIISILVARFDLFKAQVMWQVIHSRERSCPRIVIKDYNRCSSTYWHTYYQRLQSICCLKGKLMPFLSRCRLLEVNFG